MAGVERGGGGGGGTHGVKRGASVFTSVCNLANCAIGAGVLSLPYAIREMGAALGLVLAVAVAATIVFTLNTLLRAGELHDVMSYQELVLKALGPAASHLVSLTLIIYIFGSCVAYTIIVADSFSAVLGGAGGFDSPAASRDGVILAVAALVLLPLSLLRRTAGLAPASTLSVAALLYTTGAVVVKGCLQISGGGVIGGGGGGGGAGPPPLPATGGGGEVKYSYNGGGGGGVDWKSGTFTLGGREINLWRFDQGTVLALPILVFAFQCHIQVLSIFAELRDEPNREGEEGEAGELNTAGTAGTATITNGVNEHLLHTGPSPSPRSSSSSLSMLLSPSPRRTATNQTPVVDVGGDRNQSDRLVDSLGGGSGGGGGGTGIGFKSRRRATMERIVAISIVMCLVGYALVGEFAYVTHPDVQSNMLNSYGTSDPWMLAASASMGLSAIGSYPINHFSSRAALDDVLSAAFGWRAAAPGTAPAGRHVSQTLVFLSLTTAVSLRVKDLGKVFQLVGSTAGVLVICIIPGLLLLQPAPTSHTFSTTGAVRGGATSSHGGSQRRAGRGRSGARGGAGGGRGADGVDDDAEVDVDDEDVVGLVAPPRGSGGTRGRRQRHWTEGGSFGGYDELNAMATGVADQSGAATEAIVGGGAGRGGGGGRSGAAGGGDGGGAPSFRDMTHEDMRAALLPAGYRHEEEEEEEEEGDVEVAAVAGTGGGGSGRIVAWPGKRRRGCGGNGVSAADALRGYGLLILGVFISASNIYVLFSSPSAGNEKHS